ncbi:UNVERIFIED_CONTAM: hypothetical protein NY603_30505, partial [Bacteroidetes bacterium 56_B9]
IQGTYPALTAQRRLAKETTLINQYVKIQQIISPSDFFKPGDGIHPQEKPKWVMSNMILNKMVRYVRYGV